MELSVFLLVLLAAVIHASWNSWLKISGNRLIAMSYMGLGWFLFSVPWAYLLPIPTKESWIFIILSTLAHIIYSLYLVFAYRKVDLSVAYPLFRGSAPVLILVGAYVFLGESLTALEIFSILFVTLGILIIGYAPGLMMGKILFYGFAGGAMIAIYTILDGQGARLNLNSQSYASWLFMFTGLPLFFIGSIASRGTVFKIGLAESLKGVVSGILSCTAFCIIIWALSSTPMGLVAALRETSVLLVAFVSAFHLNEKVRWPGIVLVVFGLILMRL